jgi:hypothetical protein
LLGIFYNIKVYIEFENMFLIHDADADAVIYILVLAYSIASIMHRGNKIFEFRGGTHIEEERREIIGWNEGKAKSDAKIKKCRLSSIGGILFKLFFS